MQLAYHTVLFTGDEGKRANYRHSHNLISSPTAARLAATLLRFFHGQTWSLPPVAIPASHVSCSRSFTKTVSRERERETSIEKKLKMAVSIDEEPSASRDPQQLVVRACACGHVLVLADHVISNNC